MGPKASIFVGVPTYGGSICTEMWMSCLRLQQHLLSQEIHPHFAAISFPDIIEVRNIFATIWFDQTEMSHLLMIDSDMSFDPQLIVDMLEFDEPIVGVVATKKKYPIEFVGRALPGENIIRSGHMKVDGVGAGILLVKRTCFSEMLARTPDILDKYPIDKHPASDLMAQQKMTRLLRPFDPIMNVEIGRLSEDLSFSKRWIDLGGEIWANINHPIGHVGRHEFRAKYSDLLEVRNKEVVN